MIRTTLIGSPEKSRIYGGIIRQIEGCIPAGVLEEEPFEPLPWVNAGIAPEIISSFLVNDAADAVVFTSAVSQTFDTVREILIGGRHVLISPDPNLPFFQLEHLRCIAEEAGVLLYMAHHFHDAFLTDICRRYCHNPEYISITRHFDSASQARGRQVRDSLYYEIISVLALNHAALRKYTFMSVPFNSPGPSLIVVRLEFTNGSSSSLTLSRYSDSDSRIIEVFSSGSMVLSDSRKGMIMVTGDDKAGQIKLPVNQQVLQEINLNEDIRHFFQLIRKRSFPADPYISGIMTHKIASEISGKLNAGSM